ncbi:MAG: NYN domain-containing protein [Dehalococcoidia bacterium]
MAALEDGSGPKRTRRGTRGGRGRKRPTDGTTAEAQGDEAPADEADQPAAPARRAPRRTSKAAVEAAERETMEAVAAGTPAAEAEAETEKPARGRRAPAARKSAADEPAAAPAGNGSGGAILKALENQGRQIEQLVRTQEDMRRTHGAPGAIAAPPARVGVFVDAANIELACDRMRSRFDWGKILRMLTHDRTLVRALAYSPVHDDPNVSIETQRFVEPFLDKGFKIVTKPLKRFHDGTIKANVDIELALDVITMLDRLDVVCLVSGDGDFQRLVEVVQSRGVRVEVVSVGPSTAGNLRNAADSFIDLQQRLKDIRA